MPSSRWTWVGTRLLPVLVWMGLIFLLSAQPSLPSPPNDLLNFILKKAGHVTVYAVLMALLLRSATPDKCVITKRRVAACFVIVMGYALSDEFHQSFVPGRTSLLTDVAFFDLPGSLLGVAWHFRRSA